MWVKLWFKSLIYSLFINNINFKSAKEKAEIFISDVNQKNNLLYNTSNSMNI